MSALRVNKGEYYIALGEIEASKIISDKEIFAQIRKKYFELRSFRARAMRLFLVRHTDIKFVHVSSTGSTQCFNTVFRTNAQNSSQSKTPTA